MLEGGDAELSLAEQCHYLGHQDPLKPSLTVAENLLFWRDLLGGSGEISVAMTAVGLLPLADVPALYLSAGQRRRLSLARLIVVLRPIWLLDEPNSALDEAGQMLLTHIMGEHLARAGIILAATHGALGLPPTKELVLQRNRPGELRQVRAGESVV
jgi:heme exporter protein A